MSLVTFSADYRFVKLHLAVVAPPPQGAVQAVQHAQQLPADLRHGLLLLPLQVRTHLDQSHHIWIRGSKGLEALWL